MRRATKLRGGIGIIGLGLVGGSLAKALRRARPALELIGVDDDPRTLRRALADGVLDAGSIHVGQELERCACVVVAVPIGALEGVLRALRPHVRHDAVVTDVLGVKTPVLDAARRHLPGTRFVGAHPMAGGEQGGYEHSQAELFEGKPVVVCAPRRGDATPVALLWSLTGARVVLLGAEAHDRVIAVTSHLPYASALALVEVAARTRGHHVAGRGFYDATRRAAFAPEVMAAAVAHNPYAAKALRAQAAELTRLADLLERAPARFVGAAARAQKKRQRLFNAPPDAPRGRRR